jgi:hypothetical protein
MEYTIPVISEARVSYCHQHFRVQWQLYVPSAIALKILYLSHRMQLVLLQDTKKYIGFSQNSINQSVFELRNIIYTVKHEINYYILLLLHSVLQHLVGFGLLYSFVPQFSIFTLLAPVSHFHFL